MRSGTSRPREAPGGSWSRTTARPRCLASRTARACWSATTSTASTSSRSTRPTAATGSTSTSDRSCPFGRWAADGSRFVMTAMTPDDPGSILSVDAATGAVTQLVDGRATCAGRAARPAGDPDRAPHPDAGRRAGAVLPVRRGVSRAALAGRPWCTCTAAPRPRRPGCSRRSAVTGPGRLRRARAQRARLGRLRQALGLPRRPRAAARLGGGPGGDPRLAPVGRARPGSRSRCGVARTAATWCSPASHAAGPVGRRSGHRRHLARW